MIEIPEVDTTPMSILLQKNKTMFCFSENVSAHLKVPGLLSTYIQQQ
jgi:hypothetical protein